MIKEFDYKQRPFSKSLTEAAYDSAVGRSGNPPALPAPAAIIRNPLALNEDALAENN